MDLIWLLAATAFFTVTLILLRFVDRLRGEDSPWTE
jgi:hypothetical protein